MITLIHGDDITSSRKYFIDEKVKHPGVVTFDGQHVTMTDLAQVLEGSGLFNEEKTIFIENFLTKKKTSPDFKSIVTYLTNPLLSANIFLWEGKELDKSTTASLKNASIKVFKLPQSLFIFLDSIKPNNGTQLIKLFHQTLQTSEEEMIFAMIIRQFRLLLALTRSPSSYPSPLKGEGTNSPSPLRGEGWGGGDAIEEIKRVQPWQKDKLTKQSSCFSAEQLLSIYNELFAIEKAQKTGTLPLSLSSSIDILLLGI